MRLVKVLHGWGGGHSTKTRPLPLHLNEPHSGFMHCTAISAWVQAYIVATGCAVTRNLYRKLSSSVRVVKCATLSPATRCIMGNVQARMRFMQRIVIGAGRFRLCDWRGAQRQARSRDEWRDSHAALRARALVSDDNSSIDRLAQPARLNCDGFASWCGFAAQTLCAHRGLRNTCTFRAGLLTRWLH